MTAGQRIRYAIKRLEKQKSWCAGTMRKEFQGESLTNLSLAVIDKRPGCLVGALMTARELKQWDLNSTGSWHPVPNLNAACKLLGFDDYTYAVDWNDRQRTKVPILKRLREALIRKAT